MQQPATPPGLVRVICLNGISSAGKTSVARAVQSMLAHPHLVLGVDTLIDAMPASLAGDDSGNDSGLAIRDDGRIDVGSTFRSVERAWYLGMAAIARAGVGVIVDEVFLGGGASQARLRAALTGLDVLWVAVTCDLAVATAREAARPERTQGMAAAQLPLVHDGVTYDLTVDTTHRSPLDCAQEISARLASGRSPG